MDGLLQERTGQWPGVDTVDIVDGRLSRFTFAVHGGLATRAAGRAWVLRRWDRHTDDMTPFSDEASPLASLAHQVRSSWDDVGGTDGFPLRSPADDQQIVDLYYGPNKSAARRVTGGRRMRQWLTERRAVGGPPQPPAGGEDCGYTSVDGEGAVSVAAASSTDSALKRARVARNMTLEEAADALNAITGGAADASLMSAWESGRRRTGKRNRAGLCQLYRERPEVLFAHQDGAATSVLENSGTAVVVKVLARWTDLVEAMVDVVGGAREQLVVTGSRSREKAYLAAIETAVGQRPDLIHYRVLYGPPRHRALADHLVRLLELRDPGARRNGVKTLHMGIVEPTEALERFFVASETAAVVPLPSFHGAEGFDCGVLLSREAAVGLVHHGREACSSARPVETIEAVRALSVRHN